MDIYGQEEPIPGLAFKGKTKTHLVLPPDLGYVQVRKIRQDHRLLRVERHIIFGHPLTVWERLQTHGTGTIQTSYIERLNQTIRNSLARFIRRTINASKTLVMHSTVLDFLQAWYNFVKPHHSLRQPTTHSKRKWDTYTPAMAEGLTDHVWTVKELLTFRTPIH